METVKKKIAIFPGSFNPFTIGHLNVLEKVEAVFGKENVIIAVGVNPTKFEPKVLQSLIEGHMKLEDLGQIKNIKNNLPSKNVEGYISFLTDYVWEKEKAGYDVTVVKGLRNSKDLSYEMEQLRFLEDMKPDIKVMFIVCDKQYEHISSSAYRLLEAFKPGSGHKYLAKEI